MRTLAIIPARGGSKRIPRKNLAVVGGKPLWSRAYSCGWGACDAAVLSSDDRELLDCVWVGPIHRRKPEHCTDDAQLEPVIADVLAQHGADADALVLLQPTSPFRTATHVREALALLTPGVDSVVSVVRDPGYRFMGRVTTTGEYRPYRPDLSYRPRSQDSHNDVHVPVRENGAIYITRTEAFRRSGLRMSGRIAPYLMSVRDSLDIDEPWELEAARAIAEAENV